MAERSEPGRMDPPALADRHPFLHPEQGPHGVELAEHEARPAGIARRGSEQFGEDASSLFRNAEWGRSGRWRKGPSTTRLRRAVRLPIALRQGG
ncbi:hypothetical protein GCM10007925_12410 [Sphingomonas astaxanthinifaciens DSM 22298]|uniref:Uncharacterized protein n=1 Tax=Sphingomonas astaxanthinifaciens DSM 22298 TaxID=1123267 RepID=A0ABQ5Z9S5_9SPHN|nr:hypothetical protein GCM10007925_12410 [Sphingomonas astaxanthinifaciens DSM 22298]